MLPKQHRLPLRERFIPDLQLHAEGFSLKVKKNGTEQSRFAFIVSKRIAKAAVARNSTKRVMRDCVQERLSQVRPGYDMLFIAKKALMKDDKGVVCRDIYRELERKSFLKV